MDSLPDARGTFLRVMNQNREKGGDIDTKRLIGSYQSDSFSQHSHEVSYQTGTKHAHKDGGSYFQGLWQAHNAGSGSTNTSIKGAAETKPRNIAVYAYIKINNIKDQEEND